MTEKRLPHDKNGQRHKQAHLTTGTETETKQQKQANLMTGKQKQQQNSRNRPIS